MNKFEPHHIIAIGASAGGMEEINSFFDHTPIDGVSYIIVQHLSPDFKSRMVELLAKHSKLTVNEAEEGMLVKSNQVYLIPNDKYMTILNRRLYLTDKEDVKGPHLTINQFFNSLASDSGAKAIGVILSGLGSDGTEGVQSIKKAGGMVIARDPESTEFGSMPSNAIATGVVDFVLEPSAMPDTIEEYVNNDKLIGQNGQEDDSDITTIIDIIKEHLPLDFTDYKRSTILRRINRRVSYNNLTGTSDYINFLKDNKEEIEALAQDFLISVTAFFRDKEAFDVIESKVIPDILEKLADGEELKVWVAGCATGEEAYSLAMLINEQLTGKHKDRVVKIFATDIDEVALVQAGKGIYPKTIEQDVPAELLEKYFTKLDARYQVNPELRKMVIFAKHDLVKNPPYCNMQFISCRNLLIYMTPALQKKIYMMLLFGLKMDGYLFLGSSENPIPISKSLEVINKKWKIYRNLEKNRVVRFDAFALPEVKPKPLTTTAQDSVQNNNQTLSEAVNSNLVNELGYLVICIDENNHVIQFYGDTTKYLLQKNFTSNLAELLPRPLAVAFNTLSIEVLKTNKKVTVKGVKFKQGKDVMMANLAVSPLAVKKGAQKMLMVTFSEHQSVSSAKADTVFDESVYQDKYTLNLEEELRELKDKLHRVHLELDASNENMQSFNEELLSANEEMQSTNEEMQSVNEELHTINADYQLKNKELLELNDDLNNYFRSNINGQLFVNEELKLMKFSPGTVKQINLLPTDVGRPLSNISTNIKFETIENDIKKVIADGSVISKEIETDNGKWYQIMTMPYIQADNQRKGAIITFNDITELKRTQRELDKKNASLERINADLDTFVHTASHDLLAPLGNIEVSVSVLNKMKVDNPELTRFINIINSSVKKFRTLVQDIAAIGKIENDMKSMELLDLEDLISNIEWSLEDKIKDSGAEIKRHFEVTHIRFSKKNLRSILFNLISNALKFKGDRPPVIDIYTKKEGDQVILSVKDNGVGIPKEEIKNIFNMYTRLQLNVEGQGIGLYLAKKIVDATGGNIIVESAVGVGTRFNIYLTSEKEQEVLEVS